MTDAPTVEVAWNAVMNDVQAIRKNEKNKDQGFMFRGVDTVVNAVGPALRNHGVTIIPEAVDIQFHDYVTKRGTAMRDATVQMRYTVRGPAGDSFTGGAFGEAADAGDKSVSKAQSVAYRVFLLEALCIPTDEPDPDEDAHQRAAAPPPNPLLVKLHDLAGRLSADQRGQLKAWRVSQRMPEPSQMSDDERRAAIRHIEDQGWLS